MPLASLKLHQLENAFEIDGVAVAAEIGGCNLGLKLAGSTDYISARAEMQAARITDRDHNAFGLLKRLFRLRGVVNRQGGMRVAAHAAILVLLCALKPFLLRSCL